MRKWIVLAVIFCLYLSYGIYLNRYDVQVISGDLRAAHPQGFFDYKGSFHVLSEQPSAGALPASELDAAKATGLDFVIFNDANKVQPNERAEGYFNGILSIEGSSFGYLDSRLLYIPALEPREFSSLGAAHIHMADLLSQNPLTRDMSLTILAHPFKSGFQWQGDYPTGLTGVEVINLRSIWQNSWLSSRLAFLWSVFVMPFNSELALLRIYKEPEHELKLWDELAQERFTLGLAGAQSKSSRVSLGLYSFDFPTYETSFGIISNHVLLETELIGDARRDRALVVKALQQGAVYMSVDILGDPKGFNAVLEQNSDHHAMGSEISLQAGPSRIKVNLPASPRYPYEIVFLRNGQRIHSVSEPRTELTLTQPGVYRVQVRVIPTFPLPDGKKWVSWIFTNHFYVSE